MHDLTLSNIPSELVMVSLPDLVKRKKLLCFQLLSVSKNPFLRFLLDPSLLLVQFTFAFTVFFAETELFI